MITSNLPDGFLNYTWDAENRLIAIRTHLGLSPVGSTLKDFREEIQYDHASRRIRRTTFVKLNGSEQLASDEAFVYDGWNQIAALDAVTNQPRQTCVWGRDLSGSLQGAGGVGGLLPVLDVPSGEGHFPAFDRSPGEFHPQALTEPYVNLSIHTALLLRSSNFAFRFTFLVLIACFRQVPRLPGVL